MRASPVAGTAAFGKFMTVLQAVADAETPLTVAALARACGYPRATVHRIVCALAGHGMLAADLRALRDLSPAKPSTWPCRAAPR